MLNVYNEKSPGVFEQYSVNDTFTNPITTKHHGRNGNSEEVKLFLGSDGVFDHTNIQIEAITTDGVDDIGIGDERGTSGWGIKLFRSSSAGYIPTEQDWASVEYGALIDMPDMLKTAGVQYNAFWLRIESPRGISIANKTNIKLAIKFTESP